MNESCKAQELQPRRIGTFTLGIALIALGVCMLLALFIKGFPYLLVAKLSPLLLVVLGLEVLYCCFFYKDRPIKYDIISGVICFLIVSWSLGIATITPLIPYW